MLARCQSHLSAAGESYFEHMRFAMTVGTMAIGAGLACMVHALVPGACETTCSRTVAQLQRLFNDRSQLPDVSEESSGVTAFVGVLALAISTAAYVLVIASGAMFAWAAASAALCVPALYLAQNPGLDALEPSSAPLPSQPL